MTVLHVDAKEAADLLKSPGPEVDDVPPTATFSVESRAAGRAPASKSTESGSDMSHGDGNESDTSTVVSGAHKTDEDMETNRDDPNDATNQARQDEGQDVVPTAIEQWELAKSSPERTFFAAQWQWEAMHTAEREDLPEETLKTDRLFYAPVYGRFVVQDERTRMPVKVNGWPVPWWTTFADAPYWRQWITAIMENPSSPLTTDTVGRPSDYAEWLQCLENLELQNKHKTLREDGRTSDLDLLSWHLVITKARVPLMPVPRDAKPSDTGLFFQKLEKAVRRKIHETRLARQGSLLDSESSLDWNADVAREEEEKARGAKTAGPSYSAVPNRKVKANRKGLESATAGFKAEYNCLRDKYNFGALEVCLKGLVTPKIGSDSASLKGIVGASADPMRLCDLCSRCGHPPHSIMGTKCQVRIYSGQGVPSQEETEDQDDEEESLLSLRAKRQRTLVTPEHCQYHLCAEREQHATRACPLLHRRCPECNVRGHVFETTDRKGDPVCSKSTAPRPDPKHDLRTIARQFHAFEMVADHGAFTRYRGTIPSCGFFGGSSKMEQQALNAVAAKDMEVLAAKRIVQFRDDLIAAGFKLWSAEAVKGRSLGFFESANESDTYRELLLKRYDEFLQVRDNFHLKILKLQVYHLEVLQRLRSVKLEPGMEKAVTQEITTTTKSLTHYIGVHRKNLVDPRRALGGKHIATVNEAVSAVPAKYRDLAGESIKAPLPRVQGAPTPVYSEPQTLMPPPPTPPISPGTSTFAQKVKAAPKPTPIKVSGSASSKTKAPLQGTSGQKTVTSKDAKDLGRIPKKNATGAKGASAHCGSTSGSESETVYNNRKRKPAHLAFGEISYLRTKAIMSGVTNAPGLDYDLPPEYEVTPSEFEGMTSHVKRALDQGLSVGNWELPQLMCEDLDTIPEPFVKWAETSAPGYEKIGEKQAFRLCGKLWYFRDGEDSCTGETCYKYDPLNALLPIKQRKLGPHRQLEARKFQPAVRSRNSDRSGQRGGRGGSSSTTGRSHSRGSTRSDRSGGKAKRGGGNGQKRGRS